MATRREQVVAAILRERASAIIRTNDQEVAGEAIRAAVEGGFKLVEFTLTTPGACELVARFAADSELTVGAGTVMTRAQARAAVSAGARFLVSPICDPEIVAEAAALDVPIIPGTFTPTEMETAHRLGADFVKLFPAVPGGVDFVRAIRGPMPHLRMFPTAGVTPENFTEFLDAGCAGVGFVASLFTPADISERRFEAIRDRAAEITRRLAQWRSRSANVA